MSEASFLPSRRSEHDYQSLPIVSRQTILVVLGLSKRAKDGSLKCPSGELARLPLSLLTKILHVLLEDALCVLPEQGGVAHATIEDADVVAIVLAPIVKQAAPEVSVFLQRCGVRALMESAGYTTRVYGSEATLTENSASSVVGLLSSPSLGVRDIGARAIRYLSRHVTNRPLIVTAGVREAVVKMLRRREGGAAEAVIGLAQTPEDVVALVELGFAEHLVALLRESSGTPREAALVALENLTHHPGSSTAVVNAGALTPLVKLLREGPDFLRERATSVLWDLAARPGHERDIIDAGALSPLVDLLSTGTTQARLSAASALYNLCSVPDARKATIAAGAVEALADQMQRGAGRVREESAETLLRLSLDAEACSRLVATGALPHLLQRLTAAAKPWRPTLSVHAMWTRATRFRMAAVLALARTNEAGEPRFAQCHLWRLPLELLCGVFEYVTADIEASGGCPKLVSRIAKNKAHADLIVSVGGLTPIVALLRKGVESERRDCARALWSICEGPHERAAAEAGAVEALVALMREGRDAVQTDALGALQAIMFVSGFEQAVARAGAVPALVMMLRHTVREAREYAAIIIGRMARVDDVREVLVKAGAVQALQQMSADAEAQGALRSLEPVVRPG